MEPYVSCLPIVPLRTAAKRSPSSRGSDIPPQPRIKLRIPVDSESSSTSRPGLGAPCLSQGGKALPRIVRVTASDATTHIMGGCGEKSSFRGRGSLGRGIQRVRSPGSPFASFSAEVRARTRVLGCLVHVAASSRSSSWCRCRGWWGRDGVEGSPPPLCWKSPHRRGSSLQGRDARRLSTRGGTFVC